jgi:hypothetical protein
MQFLLVGVITKNLYFATFSMALPDSFVMRFFALHCVDEL